MKKTKDQVQQIANHKLDKANGRGIVEMATGTGKSKIIVDRAKRMYEKNQAISILIAVPTEKLRDVNWQDEFHKWGASHIYNECVERACYVSINKIHGKLYDMVALDEVHNITENNSKFFQQNKAKEVIGLTATMPDSREKKYILTRLNLHVVYTVTLSQAVEWGLVSPFDITVVDIELDRTLKYIKAGNKQNPFYQTEYNAYHYLTKTIDYMVDTMDTRKQYLKMLRLKRMRLIYGLESKTKASQFILEHIISKMERTLIFCGGIEQAKTLNSHSFHSKSPDSQDFDAFAGEEINRLSCVNSLNEGHNIPNVDNALIVQLNSKELNLIQRIGRIVRFREGHRAKIWVIVCKNTVDEEWAYKSLSNFGWDKIKRISFDELRTRHLHENKSRD